MGSEFKLSFSVAEKEAFLIKNGYKVESRQVEREEHIHGSRFVPFLSVEVLAIKGEYKENIHEAFEHVLKAKIMEL